MKPNYRLRFFLLQTSAASALLAASFVHAADLTLASSASAGGTITVNTSDSYTIAAGSSGARTLSNAITLGGGTLLGGVMDNVATVSGLSGAGTSSTFVDANGVTIILKGSGTANTTANLILADGVSITGANQLLVGGGGGGGGANSGGSLADGGGGGGGYVVLTTGDLSGTLALTAGGGGSGTGAFGTGGAGGTTSIGATQALGGGAGSAGGGGTGSSGQTINGVTSNFTGAAGNLRSGVGGGAGSSSNGNGPTGNHLGGAGGSGTLITTGVVGLSTYLGSDTFGGGGGGGGNNAGGGGGVGGGGAGRTVSGDAGTNGLGGGGGGGGGTSGGGGAGGAGSVAIQYAYDSNVAAGTLTLSGGITLGTGTTSTLDAYGSGGLVDITTNAITGDGGLNIASSASPGGVVRLSTANTYTGATNVNSGKLVVNGNISTSTLTTVAVGATLGGSGTVGKAIINGTLAVGNSPGTMIFTDTLGLNGITEMEIDGTSGAGVTGGHDFTNLTGAGAAGVLTYGGTMTLDIGAIFGVGSYSWDLFNMASETGTFTSIALSDQYSGSLVNTLGVWGLTSGSNTWQFTESTGVLGLTVVPEPNVAALLGGLGTLVLLRRRR